MGFRLRCFLSPLQASLDVVRADWLKARVFRMEHLLKRASKPSQTDLSRIPQAELFSVARTTILTESIPKVHDQSPPICRNATVNWAVS